MTSGPIGWSAGSGALRERLPFLRVGGLPSVLFGRRVIDPRLRAAAPDLIYARNLNWLAGVSLSVPFIAESHQPPQNAIERHLETRLFRRPSFERLVVISNKLKALYVAIFPWLAPQILVAHDGADDPRPDRSAAPREDGFHVGYVGHLYAGRGVEVILALARAVPQATFHLVGGRAEACRRLAASTDLGNVILPWPSAAARARRLLRTIRRDACTLSRAGSDRRQPRRFLGLHVAAQDLRVSVLGQGHPLFGTCRCSAKFWPSGENALLLPSADVAAWAGALRRLMADEALRHRLGSRARQDFLAYHSWERRARHVLGQSVDPCARKEPTL